MNSDAGHIRGTLMLFIGPEAGVVAFVTGEASQ